MSATKYTAAIEIGTGSVKYLAGYARGGRPVPVHKAERALPCPFHPGKNTEEETKAIRQVLRSFREREDDHLGAKLDSGSAVLLLPSLSLAVYQCEKGTHVVSGDDVIGQLDVSNVHTLVRKERIPDGYRLVDIVPECFLLSDGTIARKPPIGRRSDVLTMKAMLHLLPESLVLAYRQLVESAGFRVEQLFVESYAASCLLEGEEGVPEAYFYCDIGARRTVLTLVGKGRPFAASYFDLGSEDLTDHLARELHLSREEASLLKERRGLVGKRWKHEEPLLEKEGRPIYQDALDESIRRFLQTYGERLRAPLLQIAESARLPEAMKAPLFLGGRGALLRGLGEELGRLSLPRVSYARTFIPDVPGAMDPGLIPLLGAIAARGAYRGTMEEGYAGVSTLSRAGKGE